MTTVAPELHRLQRDVSRWEVQRERLRAVVHEALLRVLQEPDIRALIRDLVRQALREESKC